MLFRLEATQLLGGEVRRDGKSSLAHVILAGQGAEGANPKGVAAQTVLLTQLGQSASVKFQTTAGGDLGRTVSNKASASGFQTVYADAGLAGVYVVGESNNIREAVKSAAQALKTFKVGDIEVAKKKALNNALRAKAHTDSRSIERATQVLTAGEGCYIKAISEVKTSDVEAAAKKIVSKLSIASYGNVDNVPYLDEL
ncbi:unnamed protein product [Caenorhabditis auriculariae]|uniref:Peptidase M16 N-terminal domain-containing protein n=1 Tax=Caenorhabditis auriculariae TaxID=2777116 RepID=A0A8S1GZZ0_9PELO|nr:unnamed protein product [Caenorhabditis auriculariae]